MGLVKPLVVRPVEEEKPKKSAGKEEKEKQPEKEEAEDKTLKLRERPAKKGQDAVEVDLVSTPQEAAGPKKRGRPTKSLPPQVESEEEEAAVVQKKQPNKESGAAEEAAKGKPRGRPPKTVVAAAVVPTQILNGERRNEGSVIYKVLMCVSLNHHPKVLAHILLNRSDGSGALLSGSLLARAAPDLFAAYVAKYIQFVTSPPSPVKTSAAVAPDTTKKPQPKKKAKESSSSCLFLL